MIFNIFDKASGGAKASNATPSMSGNASIGSSNAFARCDHVHPTDTSRVQMNSASLTGVPQTSNPNAHECNKSIATTQWIENRLRDYYLDDLNGLSNYTVTESNGVTATIYGYSGYNYYNNDSHIPYTSFYIVDFFDDTDLKFALINPGEYEYCTDGGCRRLTSDSNGMLLVHKLPAARMNVMIDKSSLNPGYYTVINDTIVLWGTTDTTLNFFVESTYLKVTMYDALSDTRVQYGYLEVRESNTQSLVYATLKSGSNYYAYIPMGATSQMVPAGVGGITLYNINPGTYDVKLYKRNGYPWGYHEASSYIPNVVLENGETDTCRKTLKVYLEPTVIDVVFKYGNGTVANVSDGVFKVKQADSVSYLNKVQRIEDEQYTYYMAYNNSSSYSNMSPSDGHLFITHLEEFDNYIIECTNAPSTFSLDTLSIPFTVSATCSFDNRQEVVFTVEDIPN